MSEHSIKFNYDIGRIMVDAAKQATLSIMKEFNEKHPDEKFDMEQLMCYLNEANDELIVFFHDLALKNNPDKHIYMTARITDKSVRTIANRVN